MTLLRRSRRAPIVALSFVVALAFTTTALVATPAAGADQDMSTGVAWSMTSDETAFEPSSRAVDVAALEDRAVIVGTTGEGPTAAAWTSTADGAWALVELPAPDRSAMTAVTAWQDGFVAVGNRLGGDRRAFVWTSATGEEWDRQRFDGAWFSDVVTTPDGLVIVGTEDRSSAGETYRGATAWRSPDGREWQAERISFGVDQIPQAVGVTDEGELLAAGYGLTGTREDYQAVAWESGEVDDWDSVSLMDGTIAEPAFQAADIQVGPFGFLVAMTVEPQSGDGSDGRSVVVLLHNEWFGGPYTTAKEVLQAEPETAEADGSRALARVGDRVLTVAGGEVLITADGEDWIAEPDPAFDGYIVTAIADRPEDGLLAVGHALEPADAGPVVWQGQPTG